MKAIIAFLLCIVSSICFAMEKKPEPSSSHPMQFISHMINTRRNSPSPSPSPRHTEASSLSSSSTVEATKKSSTPLQGSPTGSRLHRTLGKRDSRELAGHLKEELARLEKSETLTHEELKARLEKAQKEANPVVKKKELEQLACAKVKNETFEAVGMKQKAADAIFEINAHEIAIMLQNRLMYQNEKNEQEASNQVSSVIRLFFQQHDLLLRIYESEEKTQEYHLNRWRTFLKLISVSRHIEEHLQKIAPSHDAVTLAEYQEAIKEEQFMLK